MDPTARRKMLVRMGIADPIPPVEQQRLWCFIDDRHPPEGEADGKFDTHIRWINSAASWIGWTGASCYDEKDRILRRGADFARARDEGAFPVRWYLPDRYPPPIVPTARQRRLRLAIAAAGEGGTTLNELRKTDGLRNLGETELRKEMSGRCRELDGIWDMTTEGRAQTMFEEGQFRRASQVKRR